MKSHELLVRVQVRPLCGDLTDPQSCFAAICSLDETCKQLARLISIQNPGAGVHPGRIEWSNSRSNPWSASATIRSHIALDYDRTLNELKAMSASRIAQMPQSLERDTLRRLNNAFADNGLEGTISFGTGSVVLANMAEAYPIQSGTPWSGSAIATPTQTDWTAKTLHLDREGSDRRYRTLKVQLARLPAFLVDAAGSRLIYVRGSGTINGSTLHVSRVEDIRTATREDLASADVDSMLF